MPLSANGSARTLHEERETARLLHSEQGLGPAVFRPQVDPSEDVAEELRRRVYTPVWFQFVAGLQQNQPGAPIRGLMDAFVRTCQRWRLSPSQQAILLGYGSNQLLAVDFLSGRYLNLPQDVKDRIGYTIGISIGLGALFNESIQAEMDWLNTPHPRLRNRSPLSVMLAGRMAELIATSALVDQERALR
jgi:hypothetical protein